VSTQPLVRIGARGSKLSLAQAGQMQRRIAAALGVDPKDAEQAIPLVIIVTTGDRVQDRRLLEIGGKGMFTKEIEEALIDGRIDCAIHSLKDMPVVGPAGLAIAAIPEREDPRDAFISYKVTSLEALPQGARLGTASLRRQAQALHQRPDLDVLMLRGNVDTRLAKLAAGDADAILLAAAGLHRLGLGHLAQNLIDPSQCPPAPGQGALAIQTRAQDIGAAWLDAVRDPTTALAVTAERGALAALEGSCKTAIGAHAQIAAGRLSLVVEALSPDGVHRFRSTGAQDLALDDLAGAEALGLALGRAIAEEAGDRLQLHE
jgi:hydroxymethylbilane synthase